MRHCMIRNRQDNGAQYTLTCGIVLSVEFLQKHIGYRHTREYQERAQHLIKVN